MSRPWMPLYAADYRNDTAHLSAAEHGAYLLLIMHYWTAGSLPDDDRQLSRIACMTSTEWKRARHTVQRFFHDGWKHKRIEAELARAIDISNKRRASAEQRYCKTPAIAPANAEQLDTHAGVNVLTTNSITTLGKEERSEIVALGKRRGRKPSPKTPFPDGWAPKEGITEENRADFERFRNSAHAHGRQYSDWNAAWGNWKISPFQTGVTNGTRSIFNGEPARGSREDLRRRTVAAIDQLRDYAGPDDEVGRDEAGPPTAGGFPKLIGP